MPRDPASRLSDLVDKLSPKLQRRFLEAMFTAKSTLTLEVLIGLLEEGRIEEAALVVERTIGAFASEVTRSFLTSAAATAAVISRVIDVSFHFDETHPNVAAAARDVRAELVREITEEQRRAIREAVGDGVRLGLNPREQARRVRETIGLTQRQVAAVNRYRELLQSGSSEALDRSLRDKRFDPTVRSAIAEQRVLTKTEVDRMVGRYEDRYLKYRSEVIARTEALRAVHDGNQATYEQAFEAGDLDREQVIRTWYTSRKSNVRDSHRSMHGQKRGVGEAFVSGNGNLLMRPGDRSAPLSDTAQCACSVSTTIAVDTEGIDVSVQTLEPTPATTLAG